MSSGQYIKELVEEKDTLNPSRYSHAIRLLEDEIYRMRITNNEEKFSNYAVPPPTGPHQPHHQQQHQQQQKTQKTEEEIITMTEKVIVPVNKYPNYNFVGKILGPKGSTLKAIQASSNTKISILGRGSTRDKEKEEECLESDDPKYEHLKEPLHVLIKAEAGRSRAHAQLAAALVEVKKYMIPENDKIGYMTPYQEEIVKMSEKVTLPVKEYPKYNFVGKLLGPKGNTLKSLQSTTQTKITILGKSSMRDKDKEEELIQSNESKYKHLKEPLHVLIQVEAPKSEAHARMSLALKEIKRYTEPEAIEENFNHNNPNNFNNFKENDMHLNYRGQNLHTPIIRIGIPPPGSIILSRPLPVAAACGGGGGPRYASNGRINGNKR